jgi:hypothetical protein
MIRPCSATPIAPPSSTTARMDPSYIAPPTLGGPSHRSHRGRRRNFMPAAASEAMSVQSIGVVSQSRITPEGKAQADSKAQQPRLYVSILRDRQHRHRGSDGGMKPLLRIISSLRWPTVRSAALLLAVASSTLLGVQRAGADVIHFRDGMRTVCQGKAWEEKDEVRCEYDGGVLIYPKIDVETIERRPAPGPPTASPEKQAVRVPGPASETPSAPPPARALALPQSRPNASTVLFYDPRRPKKYWSSPTAQHDSYREAVSALAADFDRPVEWVEQHMIDSNDLMEIRRHLEDRCAAGDETQSAAGTPAENAIEFYNPRRPAKYWTSKNVYHNSLAEALQALAHEFSETPEWIESHMPDSNDLNVIRQSLTQAQKQDPAQ